MGQSIIRPGDLMVIGVGFIIVIAIGFITARRNDSTDAYFMAGRKMSGWVVGFSMMATIISSLTFLALPEYTYKEDWRFVGVCFAYPIALYFALKWYMPFYRKSHVSSAYEYLEYRFGTWARLYVASAFIIALFLRMGIILYAVSVPMTTMFGISTEIIILTFGIIVILYTVMGGLEAVIWTDLIQGIGLMIGGALCLIIIGFQLPHGFAQVMQEAGAAGKLSLEAGSLSLGQLGFWVIIIGHIAEFTRNATTDQMFIQRYCAPKSRADAFKAIIIGVATAVPLWLVFTFIGTALWVYYRAFPDPAVANLQAIEVFPYFLLTKLPVGVAGFVIMSMIMAAMSTLDSSINACAATAVNDYYKRFFVKNCDDRHYLRAGRWFSIGFGAVMIVTALYIHHNRTTALQELQAIFLAIFGSGLPGLFLLGFLTRRARSIPAIISILCMILSVILWLFITSETGAAVVPRIAGKMPHNLWIGVFSNIFVFALGYLLSLLYKKKEQNDLKGLTVWTMEFD